ncbi:MAG TPA: hypothetical protein VKT77_18805 [Chthonomonadaceae bacterium]|nr:hypothetical protein [Chthonomonadaceae bacterium]
MRFVQCSIAVFALVVISSAAVAQTPTINTFFPIGGQAGKTVEVEVRGASLDGATGLLVHGTGLSGSVGVGGGKADDAGKQVWQAKCGTCHELRSPANRSLTTSQWSATVERMIKVRQAPISPSEADKITAYLLGQARSGRLTAQIKIADDCMPGVYELRVVTKTGISTAGLFEVGSLPEITSVSNTRQTALPIKLPCVANGCFAANAERHYFRFSAKKGERLVFNLKGFRYKEESVLFFNPDLRLYDLNGAEIVENHGYYDLDPLIDWTCPADGAYTLEVRDLLGRGNPGSVYRLTMGAVPYDTAIYPPAARVGTSAALHLLGKNTDTVPTSFTLPMPTQTGVQEICSPFGSMPIYVSAFPVVTDSAMPAMPVKLPATFAGHIDKPGEAAVYPISGDGPCDFELFSTRLGSPGNFALTLLDAQGRGINQTNGRMAYKLEAGKAYSLRVQEVTGKGGPEYTYAVEARPAHPHLEVAARPGNITIRPGIAAAVDIVVLRREGIVGDITIRAENLPAGVTALPAVIPPDRNDTQLILLASSGSRPVQGPIQIEATGAGPLGPTTVTATPQEIYYLQNQPTPRQVAENVVAVRGEAEFLANFATADPVKVHPRKVTEVKIKLQRRDTFKGNISARLEGLPRGWVCYPETVGPDKTEMTLLVRPNGDDTRPFMNRDPKLSPIRCVLLASSDGFNQNSMVFAHGLALCVKSDAPDDDKNQ